MSSSLIQILLLLSSHIHIFIHAHIKKRKKKQELLELSILLWDQRQDSNIQGRWCMKSSQTFSVSLKLQMEDLPGYLRIHVKLIFKTSNK